MIIRVFSEVLNYPLGLELGGYGVGYVGNRRSGDLEINGFCWQDLNGRHEVISIDALYAGDFYKTLKNDNLLSNINVAASHTHFAPMLDSLKPKLGATNNLAIETAVLTYKNRRARSVEIDSVNIYEVDVSLPIYRRFDTSSRIWNKMLNPIVGMYPNKSEDVDRRIKVLSFTSKGCACFVIVWHCCHPVSRSDRNVYSPDYVGSIREAIRAKLGQVPVLFFNGPSGDVRPGLIERRVKGLPLWGLNRRFKKPTTEDEAFLDNSYASAIGKMERIGKIDMVKFSFNKKCIDIKGLGRMEINKLCISESLSFSFLPFEVSHRYHTTNILDTDYIVSCSDDTLGYLPHFSQIHYGGYEVDNSRLLMGLKRRIWMTS